MAQLIGHFQNTNMKHNDPQETCYRKYRTKYPILTYCLLYITITYNPSWKWFRLQCYRWLSFIDMYKYIIHTKIMLVFSIQTCQIGSCINSNILTNTFVEYKWCPTEDEPWIVQLKCHCFYTISMLQM